VQDFFFTTCAGFSMSLNSPIQECSNPLKPNSQDYTIISDMIHYM
jgi:hypothetical protein